jgi:hypothetical protein
MDCRAWQFTSKSWRNLYELLFMFLGTHLQSFGWSWVAPRIVFHSFWLIGLVNFIFLIMQVALAQNCSTGSQGLQERAAGALWGLSVSEVNRYSLLHLFSQRISAGCRYLQLDSSFTCRRYSKEVTICSVRTAVVSSNLFWWCFYDSLEESPVWYLVGLSSIAIGRGGGVAPLIALSRSEFEVSQ